MCCTTQVYKYNEENVTIDERLLGISLSRQKICEDGKVKACNCVNVYLIL